MQPLRNFLSLLLGVSLAGCVPLSLESTPITPPQLNTPLSPSMTWTPVQQATATSVPSLVMPTATSSLVPQFDTAFKYQHLAIATELSAEAKVTGTLVLAGHQPYRFNLDQRVRQDLPEVEYCLSVSPNGRWLAYCQPNKDSSSGEQLVVESADGQQRKFLPVGKDWWWDFSNSWLDNDHLVFNVWKNRAEVLPVYPVVVVDPFTGDQQELASDYPGLRPSLGGPAGTLQFVYNTVVYHPSLELVIYPQTTASGYHVVLWDRLHQKPLASIKDLGGFLHTPIWSPDGSQFVVAVMNREGKNRNEVLEEWFSVSREGYVQQLTHFADLFTNARIGHASWSPDGQRLAFWLDASPAECDGQRLAVMKMASHEVVDYCVPGSDNRGAQASVPVWSPDSGYVAVDDYHDDVSHPVIINIEQGWAAQVGDGVFPVGWLTSQP